MSLTDLYRLALAAGDIDLADAIPFEPVPVPVLVDPITGEVVSVEERRDTRGIYYTPVIPCPSGKSTMSYAVAGPGGVKAGRRQAGGAGGDDRRLPGACRKIVCGDY